jgi:hypothetical protein
MENRIVKLDDDKKPFDLAQLDSLLNKIAM